MLAPAIQLTPLLPGFRPSPLRRASRAMPRPEPLPRRRASATLAVASTAPIGVAWSAGQDAVLHWCWADTPAQLLRKLSREIPERVLRFSEAGHGLGILLRVAADQLDVSSAADPSRILALSHQLRPWVSLHWCGDEAGLRQGQGAFASAYVNAFLGWDSAVQAETGFQPEVPSYRLAEFQAAMGVQ